jgi:hypothetical protein
MVIKIRELLVMSNCISWYEYHGINSWLTGKMEAKTSRSIIIKERRKLMFGVLLSYDRNEPNNPQIKYKQIK